VIPDEPIDSSEAPVPDRQAPPVDDGRLIGGVCALIADRLGLDVLWVRIAFVVMALTGGIGLLVYAGLWLILVAAPNSGWRWVRIAGGAVMIGLVPLFLQAGSLHFMTGQLAVVLLLLGLMLALWNPRRTRSAPRPPVADADAGSRNAWWAAPRNGTTAAPQSASPPPPPPPPPRPTRQRSLLGRATLGLALMVAAVGALIDLATGERLHPEQWLGAAGVVCGIGLLLGVVRGRARWLILPAVGFALVGFATGELARMGIGIDNAAGDRYVYVNDAVRGSLSPRTGVGTVYIQVDSAPTQPITIDARVAGGRVDIAAADDVTVLVRARLDNGSLINAGNVVLDGSGEFTAGPDAQPDVVVDAWVGHGDVRVDQYPATAAVPPDVPLPALPAIPGISDVGSLIPVDDWVSATPDGWIVLGGGEAVIDPDDRVVSGQVVDSGSPSLSQANEVTITTSIGEYRLLPRGLLVTPDMVILDLHAVRSELAPSDRSDPPDPADSLPSSLPPAPTAAPAPTIGGQP
jgi:phage shock protein PspC (stress-responsive transcriptional regulator)